MLLKRGRPFPFPSSQVEPIEIWLRTPFAARPAAHGQRWHLHAAPHLLYPRHRTWVAGGEGCNRRDPCVQRPQLRPASRVTSEDMGSRLSTVTGACGPCKGGEFPASRSKRGPKGETATASPVFAKPDSAERSERARHDNGKGSRRQMRREWL
jgi:hypothetical protein